MRKPLSEEAKAAALFRKNRRKLADLLAHDVSDAMYDHREFAPGKSFRGCAAHWAVVHSLVPPADKIGDCKLDESFGRGFMKLICAAGALMHGHTRRSVIEAIRKF